MGRPSEGLFYGRPRGWREAAAARRWPLPLICGGFGRPAVRAAWGIAFYISGCTAQQAGPLRLHSTFIQHNTVGLLPTGIFRRSTH